MCCTFQLGISPSYIPVGTKEKIMPDFSYISSEFSWHESKLFDYATLHRNMRSTTFFNVKNKPFLLWGEYSFIIMQSHTGMKRFSQREGALPFGSEPRFKELHVISPIQLMVMISHPPILPCARYTTVWVDVSARGSVPLWSFALQDVYNLLRSAT